MGRASDGLDSRGAVFLSIRLPRWVVRPALARFHADFPRLTPLPLLASVSTQC
jgi:hypothetical protein